MIESSRISYIVSRESGDGLECPDFGPCPDSVSVRSFENYSNSVIRGTSTTVWVSGRENVTVALNSHGQVVVYNMMDCSKDFVVTQPSEYCFKCFFARDCLLMAVREKNEDFVDFFEIPIISLQISSNARRQILSRLRLRQNEIKEIDPVSLKIVVENKRAIQVWDINTETCLANFPVNSSIQYQVTGDYFVYWETCKNETKLGVLKLDKTFSTIFSVSGGHDAYFCKITGDQLILGFKGCNLQVVDLRKMESRVIKKGVPLKLFELEKTGKTFFLFSDNSCFIDTEDDSGFNVFQSKDYLISELCDKIVVCGDNGKVGIFTDHLEIFPTQFTGIQQIGCNPDSGQILIACKGRIWVIE